MRTAVACEGGHVLLNVGDAFECLHGSSSLMCTKKFAVWRVRGGEPRGLSQGWSGVFGCGVKRREPGNVGEGAALNDF